MAVCTAVAPTLGRVWCVLGTFLDRNDPYDRTLAKQVRSIFLPFLRLGEGSLHIVGDFTFRAQNDREFWRPDCKAPSHTNFVRRVCPGWGVERTCGCMICATSMQCASKVFLRRNIAPSVRSLGQTPTRVVRKKAFRDRFVVISAQKCCILPLPQNNSFAESPDETYREEEEEKRTRRKDPSESGLR